MIASALAKMLVVLGLASMGMLVMFRDSLSQSIPVAFPKILSGRGDRSPNFVTARPTARVSAKKAQLRTKPVPKGQVPNGEEVAQPNVPVLEVVILTPPFPSRSEVSGSMSRADLIARFGEPDASAAWSHEGTLSEKFIYQNQDNYTEIQIQGGKVAPTRKDNAAR